MKYKIGDYIQSKQNKTVGEIIEINEKEEYPIITKNGFYKETQINKINIPEDTIKNNMEILDITRDEAIEMWLDDNDYTTNEEVEELTKKAKDSGADKIKADRKPRAKREVTRKENPTKEQIIAEIAHFLAENSKNSTIKVENVGKIITFERDGHKFKLDLIQTREKKQK